MSLIRTFIAVDVSPHVRSRAADLIERLRPSGVKATWTKTHNTHLTLKFLGDTPDVRIPDICRAVAEASAQVAPFQLRFCGAGAFPNNEHPRTVWLGVSDGKDEVVGLQSAVDEALAKLGFRKEQRRFVAHLTIGRVRGGGSQQKELGRLVQRDSEFDAGIALVDEVLIFASFLDKTGPTYQVLGRAPLGGD